MFNVKKNENVIFRVYQPTIPVDKNKPPRMISGVVEPKSIRPRSTHGRSKDAD